MSPLRNRKLPSKPDRQHRRTQRVRAIGFRHMLSVTDLGIPLFRSSHRTVRRRPEVQPAPSGARRPLADAPASASPAGFPHPASPQRMAAQPSLLDGLATLLSSPSLSFLPLNTAGPGWDVRFPAKLIHRQGGHAAR